MIPSRTFVTVVIAILSIATSTDAVMNGVGKLPVMGYNAWNAFAVSFVTFTAY